MEKINLEKLHKKALPIFEKASQMALNNFRKNIGFNVKTDKTGFKSVVTEADKKIDKFLSGKLTEIFPGSGFLSEEQSSSLSDQFNWIIDPIDGTANYHKGVDFWGIFISLKDRGETIYAAMLFPTLMCKMIYGFKNGGVYDDKNQRILLTKSDGYKIKYSADSTNNSLKLELHQTDFGFKTSYMQVGSVAGSAYSFLRGAYDFMVIHRLDLYDLDSVVFLSKEMGYRVDNFNGKEDDSKFTNRGLDYKLMLSKPEIRDLVFSKVKKLVEKYD